MNDKLQHDQTVREPPSWIQGKPFVVSFQGVLQYVHKPTDTKADVKTSTGRD